MQKQKRWRQRRARDEARSAVPQRRSYYAQAAAQQHDPWLNRGILAAALLASIGLHVAVSEVPPPQKGNALGDQLRIRTPSPLTEEALPPPPPPPPAEPHKSISAQGPGAAAPGADTQNNQQHELSGRQRIEQNREQVSSLLAALGADAATNAVERLNDFRDIDESMEGMVAAQNLNRGELGLAMRNAGEPGGGGSLNIGGLVTNGKGGRPGHRPYGIGAGDPGRKHGALVDLGGGEQAISAGYDRALVSRTMNKHLSQIRYCYQKQLNRDPALYGKVTVQFTINGEGLVSVAVVKATTMLNAEVESCVVGIVKRIAFPEPKGGGIVQVSYPFLFNSAGRSGLN